MASDAPRVLVVEDEPAIAMALRSLFRRSGWEATLAKTVADARALLTEGLGPSWVVLDLMLPDGSGEEVLAHIRRENQPVKVAVVTGVGDPERLKALRKLGADVVLRKPVAFDEIMRAMGLE